MNKFPSKHHVSIDLEEHKREDGTTFFIGNINDIELIIRDHVALVYLSQEEGGGARLIIKPRMEKHELERSGSRRLRTRATD